MRPPALWPLIIGGVGVRACQESTVFRSKSRTVEPQPSATRRIGEAESGHRSGARAAGLARAIGAVGVDVERSRAPFDDFARDDDFFDTFEARQIEHGVEQNC